MNRREALALLASVPAVASVSRASLKSDDVLVVECDGLLSQQGVENIQTAIQQIWPGHKCVVLDGRMKLKVLSKPEAERT